MKKKLYQKPAFRAECIYFEDSLAAGSNDSFTREYDLENDNVKIKYVDYDLFETAEDNIYF